MTTAAPIGALHTWRQRVSVADLDWHGHVNNVRMISWIQDSWTDLVSPGEGVAPAFAVVNHHADYLKPLSYRSWVNIRTAVSEIRRSSVTGTARVTDGIHTYAEITTTWVAFDSKSRRARSFTEQERERLERHYLDAGAGAGAGAGGLPGQAQAQATARA
jgi:acyl-CoA thioesterase FadM